MIALPKQRHAKPGTWRSHDTRQPYSTISGKKSSEFLLKQAVRVFRPTPMDLQRIGRYGSVCLFPLGGIRVVGGNFISNWIGATQASQLLEPYRYDSLLTYAKTEWCA